MKTKLLLTPLLALCLPLAAQASVFVNGGQTSVALDFATLESAASLELSSADPTATAAPGFAVGFAITNSTPFTYDIDPFTPLGGSIGHTGSVTFLISGTTDEVTVGNFDIGFDAGRISETPSLSGFFVEDTFSGLGILFDVGAPATETFSASAEAFFAEADLFVSPEFAGFLFDAGLAASDLTGALIGSAQIDAAVIPEPSLIGGLFGAAALSLVLFRRRRKTATVVSKA